MSPSKLATNSPNGSESRSSKWRKWSPNAIMGAKADNANSFMNILYCGRRFPSEAPPKRTSKE